MKSTFALLLALASLSPAPLRGQEPEPDTTPVPVAPLTVTVLRQPQPPDEVPYAVAEADAVALRRGKTGAFLEEALSGLPGVQVQNRFNYAVGERLAIRGFGARAQFGVRGVKVLVDGIPATLPDGQATLDHIDLSSVGRAEVLRGPGSALYGNAAGGVLVLRTAEPRAGPVRPRARLVGGSDGLWNATAGVEGWIGSSSLRVDGSRLTYDGFRAHPDGEGTYGAAARSLLNAQLRSPLAGGALRLTLNAVDLDAENPGSLPRDLLSDEGRPAWGFNVAQDTHEDIAQAQLGAAWSGAPVAGGRVQAAAWLLGRTVTGFIPPAVIELDRRAGGGRLLWGSGEEGEDGAPAAFFWGAGLEVELQRDDRKNFENDGGVAGARTLDQLESVLATGAFVRAGVRPGARVRVSGALRYDRFRLEVDDRRVTSDDPDDSGGRTLDALSPTLGIVFRAHPRATLWANVATALETPTTTELVNRPDGGGGFNPDLEPQHSRSVEVGARGSLGGRVRWEVAAFRTEIDDDLVPFESDRGRVFYRNAGASTHDGVEVTLGAGLGAGLGARATYSHVDASFDAYEVDGNDFAGNRVPGLAPHRLGVALRQDRPAWFWDVEAEWTDDVPVDDANSEAAQAHWLVDLRAGLLDRALGPLVVSPFAGVANLLDRRYTTSVTVNGFGGRYYEPGPGRTAYAGLSVGWSRR